MGLKFSIPYQIPFYETDITHHVKLPHLLAFSLQVSGMQSESLGNTDKDVFDNYGLVWIVTDYAIEIDRLPRYNEKVTITTEAISYNKIFCYRNFYIINNRWYYIRNGYCLYNSFKLAHWPCGLI